MQLFRTGTARFGLTCIVLALAGCARVAIYSDSQLDDETGVTFYTPKPYLLVSRTGAKEKPVEVSVIYIPDLSKPLYAKAVSGLGTSNLSMAFSNGILTSFGEQTDSKVPELVTSLGSFISSAASGAKPFFGLQSGVDYTEQGKLLESIAKDLSAQLEDARRTGLLTTSELQFGDGIVRTLNASANLLQGPQGAANAPTVISNVKGALEQWDKIRAPNAASTSEQSILGNIAKDKELTQSILNDLVKGTGGAVDQPTYTLFEIDNRDGNTVLREVR